MPANWPNRDCKMIEESEKKSNISNDSMKITVLMNGPYIVTGRVPLITMEIFAKMKTLTA